MILARYRNKATASEEIEVAYYVIETDYQTQVLNLESMVPRKETYNYDITVSNEKNGIVTETAIEYIIQIKTTTNLPLKYALYDEKDNNIIETTETIQDEDGVYYINFTSQLKGFRSKKRNT